MEIKQTVKGYPTQEFPAEIFKMGYTRLYYQALFKLEIKKKRRSSIDHDIHHSEVFQLSLVYWKLIFNFSLDIEGGEFQVLKTIPWSLVDIQVLSIETHYAGFFFLHELFVMIIFPGPPLKFKFCNRIFYTDEKMQGIYIPSF